MAQHRWSGWPGAYCMDCGADDPYEMAVADNKIDFVDAPEMDGGIRVVIPPDVQEEINKKMVCPEPGSKRHDPYARAAEARATGCKKEGNQ